MATPLHIHDILAQVKRLDKKAQLNLLQQLIAMLKETETSKNEIVRLSSLAGMGSEIWESVNHIDHYIDEERQW